MPEIHDETITITLPDGYPCHARLAAPANGQPAGMPILYLHGIQSHGGWFTESARRLAEAGHLVLMPDRRGSGANECDRGHARSVRQLLADGRVYLQKTAELAGRHDEPVAIIGVSWGGKWALALAADFPDRVASIILSTPGLYAQRTLGPVSRLAVAFCAAFAPQAKFTIPLSEPELFTDVDRWRRFIADDPLRLRKASARFLLISHLMEKRLPRWAGRVICPALLLLADRDPIIDNARVLELLARSLPADRLTVKRFCAAVHTLEFTADPAGYFDTLVRTVAGG